MNLKHRVSRASARQRHARPISYTPGWYVTQAAVTAVFIPAIAYLITILGGPVFYGFGL